MLKGSTVTVDLPPETHQHHQKHENSNKPTPRGLFNYGCLLWILELFVKFIAFLVTLYTLNSIWAAVENCLDLISEWPWIGSFLLIIWISWIPTFGFVWYAFRSKNGLYLIPYLSYNFVFQFIQLAISAIITFSFFYPSIKEAISNPKIMEVVNDFTIQNLSNLPSYIIMTSCYFCFEYATLYREEYFLGKTEP